MHVFLSRGERSPVSNERPRFSREFMTNKRGRTSVWPFLFGSGEV